MNLITRCCYVQKDNRTVCVNQQSVHAHTVLRGRLIIKMISITCEHTVDVNYGCAWPLIARC